MAISALSLVITNADTGAAVTNLQATDAGTSYKVTFTFAELIFNSSERPTLTGNFPQYFSSMGITHPGSSGSTELVVSGTLRSNLTIDIPAFTLGISKGFETASGEIVKFSSMTSTDVDGNPVYGFLGTAPEITTGNGATAAVSVDEGSTIVTDVNSSDDGRTDPSSISYSLSGADAALFTINSSSGALSFKSAPNFENPSDAGGDGVYDVTVTVTDNVGQTDTQDISITVDDINDDPTGSATISGTAQEGEELSASNTLADEDGLGAISYQWLRGGVEITGATSATYTLTQVDVGAVISVTASYTDGEGTAEAVTSADTSAVVNVNDAPTGSVMITGTALEGEMLSASNTLADEDGLGTVSYQWLRDSVAILGATDASYLLTVDDGEAKISVRATYTDGQGTAEAVTSGETDVVLHNSRNLVGTEGDDILEGFSADDTLEGLGGNDLLAGGLGIDTMTGGDGADAFLGSLSELMGDTISDFTSADTIIFKDTVIAADDISLRKDADTFIGYDVDGNGSITSDEELRVQGLFEGGEFMFVSFENDTFATFNEYLPVLTDGRAVDSDLVDGIINQMYLTGDGSKEFAVSLMDIGGARYDNVLGVYEIAEDGSIDDVQFIFTDTGTDDDASSEVIITGIEDGHRLGFFIVQDAANWAKTLTDTDVLSFVNDLDETASLADGNNLMLAVNGVAVDETVFHSFAASMNSDGMQHVLAGAEVGGAGLNVGFEDKTGLGDADYEDVIFHVETSNDWV